MARLWRITSAEFLVFFSVWLVFNFNGLIDGAIIGRNGIPSWLILISAIWVVLYFNARRLVRFDRYSVLFFIFFVLCLPAFVSFYNFYSFSVLSILICIMISAGLKRQWTLSLSQKQLFFSVGIVIAFLSLVMFFYFTIIDRPRFGVDLIRPGYGYAIDRGVLLRLVGFADDPNFYVLGMIFPLLLGMSEKLKYRKIGIFIIVLSMILTFSRSGLVAVVAGLFVFYCKRIDIKHFVVALVFVGAAFGGIAVFDTLMGELKTSDNVTVERSFLSGMMSRNNLLSLALREEEIKLFGNGIGRAKEVIGIHSHNSYFDYIFDAGIIPFVFLLLIMAVSVYEAFKRPTLVSAYTISIMVGAAALSISYQPMLLLMVMISGRYRSELSSSPSELVG
ncbi:hypothetical protein HCU74_19265 [Spongiibacter sp. KMU-166]|uniref:O-Antigen ligase n=1 Tax=Spongiibacter thalassae TaxID=2721624 RepID=A0ABX1GMB0_9GAMM|nr:hypothetical protein [Spongiibacter thalassae]NKI19552.1 hypothetical protein [Spongiibacter thalassae]